MRSTSTADPRIGVRRAALHAALRDGDDLAAARAASRLRPHSDALDAGELAGARAARARLGRAIREARRRRRIAEAGPRWERAAVARAAPPSPRPRRSYVQSVANGVAVVAAVALVAALLFPRPAVPDEPAPAAAPRDAAVRVASDVTGRGRTTAAVALQAAPSAAPTPAPTAEPAPTVAPAQTAPPSAPPVRAASPGGSPAGVAGGVPGGVPGGQPGGTGSATPIPTPFRAPLFWTPAPAGWGRVMFVVSDAVDGAPLQDVCVSIGLDACTPQSFHTNALGVWFVDLPSDAAFSWYPRFVLGGYGTVDAYVEFRGKDITVEIRLPREP